LFASTALRLLSFFPLALLLPVVDCAPSPGPFSVPIRLSTQTIRRLNLVPPRASFPAVPFSSPWPLLLLFLYSHPLRARGIFLPCASVPSPTSYPMRRSPVFPPAFYPAFPESPSGLPFACFALLSLLLMRGALILDVRPLSPNRACPSLSVYTPTSYPCFPGPLARSPTLFLCVFVFCPILSFCFASSCSFAFRPLYLFCPPLLPRYKPFPHVTPLCWSLACPSPFPASPCPVPPLGVFLPRVLRPALCYASSAVTPASAVGVSSVLPTLISCVLPIPVAIFTLFPLIFFPAGYSVPPLFLPFAFLLLCRSAWALLPALSLVLLLLVVPDPLPASSSFPILVFLSGMLVV